VESGGGGAKSYDGETAWTSINHSILAWKNNHDIHFILFGLFEFVIRKKEKEKLSMLAFCLNSISRGSF
jgi:hypothetical protein